MGWGYIGQESLSVYCLLFCVCDYQRIRPIFFAVQTFVNNPEMLYLSSSSFVFVLVSCSYLFKCILEINFQKISSKLPKCNDEA